MENKKYEQLIDLIINENEDKARELFHEIVVEKSREIYENIMTSEMSHDGMEEADQVGGLMAEIEAEGVHEADEEGAEEVDHDAEEAGDELTHDLEKDAGDDDMDIEDKVDDLEDRVVNAEDEIERLIAKFEAELGGADAVDGEEVEVAGDEEMMEAADDEEDAVEEAKEEDEDKEKVEEAVALKKVSVTHGDNGANTKSPALHEPKVKTAGVNPVMSKGTEAVPNGPKAPSNYATKGEKEVPGAGKFKNTPGHDNFKEKGESAPKPVTSQASGVNNKSPVSKG